MVFPRERSQQPHLLKPCHTSIDRSEAVLPRQNRSDSSPYLKALHLSVSFHGWRLANTNFKSWARKMADLHEPTWIKAGIFEAIMASTYRIYKNTDLVLGVAEKWNPDTKTFVFPWGETTITLEDVMVLLGFSVLGLPVFATVDSSEKKKMFRNLEKEWTRIKKVEGQFLTQVAWIERFMDSGDELEHTAFLVLWLSYFVFPSRYYHISEDILPIAVHLSSGTRIAIAPAILAHLYAELSLLKTHISGFTKSPVKIELGSMFKLVQLWIWERFKELRPKPNMILKGEPRLARWYDLRQRRTSQVWQILENSSFEWRPYTKALKNWKFPQFYPEKAMRIPVVPNLDDEFISYARCIKVSKLVGIDCVEYYFPNRVAAQFGMLQNVPSPVNRKKVSKEAAWNDYNKPIDDLTLYIPSRSTIPCVTPSFSEWWEKSFPEFQYSSKENQVSESAETSKSRNIIGDDTSFVPSGSKMNRRSDVGMKIPEKSRKARHKYMERVPEDDDPMDRFQTQVPSDNDDSLITRKMKRRRFKKYNDVENIGGEASESLGKRSRLEVDNNDSDPHQTHVSLGDMMDGGNKEPDCLLHEDGDIAGEKQRSDEKLCSEAEKEDDVADDGKLIKKELKTEADDNESIPCQKFAYGGVNGDEVLCPSDESNILITVGDGSHGHGFPLHDNGVGSEETMKSKEQLENLEKRKNDFGEGDDSNEKSLQELKVMATSLEERIIKAQKTVALLKERRAAKQRKLASARLI